MLDKNALKAEFVRNGYTQKDIAALLNISEKTLISRLNRGVFGTDEAQILVDRLHIKNPSAIFFAKEVT
jgi:transcriptional regulator with XRE-family HTH domain